MAKETRYLYGPVPSRRLGLSLGVDIVPFKTCTLDCVYCQLGRTTCKTLERKEYVPTGEVLAELRKRIDVGLKADYITLGGSGEPTLHSGLGRLIAGIKEMTAIPVSVLTNGTLLYMPEVRADCARADAVLPSLDAGDELVFEKINRPLNGITFERLVEGLCALRREYRGQLWLEVFLIAGFNTDKGQIGKLAEAIRRIGPDKVHLNTAVRPTAEPGIEKIRAAELTRIARQLGANCEVIADYLSSHCGSTSDNIAETVLSMLKRRPCSVEDLCGALGIDAEQAARAIAELERQRLIHPEKRGTGTYYRVS